jgi:hypothetical protein
MIIASIAQNIGIDFVSVVAPLFISVIFLAGIATKSTQDNRDNANLISLIFILSGLGVIGASII